MARLTCLVALMLMVARAAPAQEAHVPPPPPPPAATPPPPPAAPPPPPSAAPAGPPPAVAPCPLALPLVATPAEIDDLERYGRHKRRTGIILMANGGGIVIAGTALLIAGWVQNDHGPCYRSDGYNGYDGYSSSWCGNQSLVIAGGTTMLMGYGALFAGVPLYLSGGSDVAHAQRLRALDAQAGPPPR